MDVAGFLRGFPPFDGLDDEQLARVSRAVEVEHVPAGGTILTQLGEPSTGLYVIRKGEVELLDNGVVRDVLGEGEVFGELSLLSDEAPSLTVRATEDTLCYVIPAKVATGVLGSDQGQRFVIGSLGRRIHAFAEHARVDPIGARFRTVGTLVRRGPVTVPAGVTVADAAALMAARRVSCLLVEMRDGWGIVTDRDLRTRVVAAQRDYLTPVERVATFPAITLGSDAMAGEALLEMFANDVHHFPVADATGRILGVVTDTDLMWVGRHTPFAIRSGIERASSREEAVAAARELPQVVMALVEASADPISVGHVVALVVDALTQRLLRLGIDRLGEAPAPWAWLALGSAARQEQALHTDQDHALAFEPGDRTHEELDPYFAELAEFVTAGLESAGIPRCHGDAMATTPMLRRSVDGWVELLHTWMRDPGREGSILSSIVYDYRRVAGTLEVEPAMDAAIVSARDDVAFLHHLGRRALDAAPPAGFFRGFVVEDKGDHAGTLDVKRRGITIIGNIARVHAIGAGITNKRTLARLSASAAAGAITTTEADELAEAFRYLWEVRLRHQVEQVRAGLEADDHVDPKTLGPVARRGLREAFRVIRRAQATLASELGVRAP